MCREKGNIFNMNIKKIFKYEPQPEYDFNIQSTENATVQDLNSEKIDKKVNMLLQENLEFVQSKFNSLISSDVIIRKFVKIKNIKLF